MILGIDASRCRSGGAINHIKGILKYFDPGSFEINEVHIWSYDKLLNEIPDYDWLKKHHTQALNHSIFAQLFWQFNTLSKILKSLKCDILYTADASTLCSFKKQIVFSQDLLAYEPGIEKSYGISFSRIRLLLIRILQDRAFKNALGVVFLTNYTSNLIQKSCGHLKNYKVIPHGFNEIFSNVERTKILSKSIVCTYISNIDMYKNQENVVKSIEFLRKKYDIILNLVGGGEGRAFKNLSKQIKQSDPEGVFVSQYGFLTHEENIQILNKTDIFIFASSCETFGITLLEGMAAGMTIACSNKSSLPELIEDGGILFDPTNSSSISNALEQLISNENLRLELSIKARKISNKYSWRRCSVETFKYISETYKKYPNE
ncbi:glycosyltransferase [Akkermansiaceae bacterium]|nr:glycosyltransferase [Akkermansiaceae bacterium]